MSKFNFKINDYRPCEVNENGNVRRALFHMWTKEETLIAKIGCAISQDCIDAAKERIFNEHIMLANESPILNTVTFALVEFEDGSVVKMKPESVRFLDANERFREYCVFDDICRPKMYQQRQVEVVKCPICHTENALTDIDSLRTIMSEFGNFVCKCKSCNIQFDVFEIDGELATWCKEAADEHL